MNIRSWILLTFALCLGGGAAALARDRVQKAAPAPATVAQAAHHATPVQAMTKAQKIAAFKKLVSELGKVPSGCQLKGKNLWGKIQVVTSFPDFKVKKVTSFPDLKVKWVTSFPDSCGKWQKTTSFPDFKIQWVDSFPDFTIQTVTSFPGVN